MGRLKLLVGLLLLAGLCSAQNAPVPAKIITAKRVFISNAGVDGGLFPHPFSGPPDRGYNDLYAGMRAWGRFELVSDPAEADLVLEIRLLAPNGPANANKINGAADPLPVSHLQVYDRATHVVLWAFSESVDPANLQKTHDKNLDESIKALIQDLRQLVETRAVSGS